MGTQASAHAVYDLKYHFVWALCKLYGWFGWVEYKRLYERLDVAVHCCAKKQGILLRPGTGKPVGPGDPSPKPGSINCDQVGIRRPQRR